VGVFWDDVYVEESKRWARASGFLAGLKFVKLTDTVKELGGNIVKEFCCSLKLPSSGPGKRRRAICGTKMVLNVSVRNHVG
jgi:hypothetical protein